MNKPSIFTQITKSIDNLITSSEISEVKESKITSDSHGSSLIEYPSAGAELKKLELYISGLVFSLNRGELPVNLTQVTQVFDGLALTNRLSIDVPANKFVELYNDLPNILTGYAIDATLSDESYRQTETHQITFNRLNRGSYWIFPTDRIGKPGLAWLVPNPLKDLQISKTKSLNFCFDVDSSSQSANTIILAKPALVQLLPNAEQLIWKLIERGVITNGNRTNAASGSIDSEQLTKQAEIIRSIASKHEQLKLICTQTVEQLAKQQQVVSSIPLQLEKAEQQEREITSLKIELAKLKADYQSKQKQKNTIEADFYDRVKSLIHQELENINNNVPLQIGSSVDMVIESDTIASADSKLLEVEIIDKTEPQLANNLQLSPFAQIYNSGIKDFLRSYLLNEAKLVQSDRDTIQLVEDRTGIYWIVPINDTTNYLVPSLAPVNHGKYFQGLASLFDGNTNDLKLTLLKPAIVSVSQSSKPKQWKLLQKGLLQ
jgi:hypothetical protein